jgi:hypothetical protein
VLPFQSGAQRCSLYSNATNYFCLIFPGSRGSANGEKGWNGFCSISISFHRVRIKNGPRFLPQALIFLLPVAARLFRPGRVPQLYTKPIHYTDPWKEDWPPLPPRFTQGIAFRNVFPIFPSFFPHSLKCALTYQNPPFAETGRNSLPGLPTFDLSNDPNPLKA